MYNLFSQKFNTILFYFLLIVEWFCCCCWCCCWCCCLQISFKLIPKSETLSLNNDCFTFLNRLNDVLGLSPSMTLILFSLPNIYTFKWYISQSWKGFKIQAPHKHVSILRNSFLTHSGTAYPSLGYKNKIHTKSNKFYKVCHKLIWKIKPWFVSSLYCAFNNKPTNK